MPKIRKRVYAGKTVTITECFAPNFGKRLRKCAEGHEPTPEDVKKVNQRRAEQELTYMVDHNFGPGDVSTTLTYPKDEKPISRADADRRFRNFIARLKRRCEKQGIELKWIKVTEQGKGDNFHHHVIMNKMDTAMITEVWAQEGYAFIKHLDNSGHYPDLAEYLVKERPKRQKEGCKSRSWSCSSNLEKPKVEVDILKRNKIQAPKVPEGYYLDEKSLYSGIHELTGLPYQRYTIVEIPKKRKGG